MSRRRVLIGCGATILCVIAIFLFATGDRVVQIAQVVRQIPPTVIDPNADIEPQPQLENPPAVVKAIYATNWSAGSAKKVSYFLDLLNTTELNAIVIDVKDYTGVVGYATDAPDVKKYGAWEKRIPKINALIKKFHDAGVYVIGRIAVFQDGALVQARPDLALHSSSTGAVWGDTKGVHWLDTASKEVWDYTIAIAKDALSRGFDEINFDYIRFPSDGNVTDIRYPFYNRLTPKSTVLNQFFSYLRQQLPQARLSADIFGEVTYQDSLGIGQRLSDTLPAFDYIAPMVYPSHYANGFNGFPNPATQPYAVVHYSLEKAINRTNVFITTAPTSTPERAVFRPWLQDFNLGATYDAAKVRAQIQALDDLIVSSTEAGPAPIEAGRSGTTDVVAAPRPLLSGWMLWNPNNVYTKAALLPG